MSDIDSIEQLKLCNQLCFPVYAASRLIIRTYQPYLDKLEITYPQYLVLLVLWENDGQTVNDIAQKLILNTNTVTPLLKRMESAELISRKRDTNDERKVLISLTEKGKLLRTEVEDLPKKLMESVLNSSIELDELIDLREKLNKLISVLNVE